MAQSDTGNAVLDEISGPYRKVYDTVTKYLGDPSKPAARKKVDPSWHNDMVRKANESFAKSKPLTNKTIGGKKRATKGKASQKKASKRE